MKNSIRDSSFEMETLHLKWVQSNIRLFIWYSSFEIGAEQHNKLLFEMGAEQHKRLFTW